MKGQFDPIEGGTAINVTQKPRGSFWLFAVFWFVLLITILASFILRLSAEANSDPLLSAVGPIFMMAFGLFLFLTMFWQSAAGTKFLLKLILDAKEQT